ncbi:CENP-B homolog protein 2-like [Echinops telfairi]|uniref:CENP-B homolog protein 2-like n=1 Tax=Echinops telfairi TaxID=9371 RepID=A0AC55DP15_ECHTE|nr:CENP-B homolog protein 2-like [Echinops telfairi]
MDKKVRNLSLKEKLDVVKMITEEKKTVKEAVIKFKCGKSQIYSIIKEKDKIIQKYMSSANINVKKGRDGNYAEINKSVFEWFLQASAQNIPISGPILQAKAKEMAKLLKVDGFSASNGWLQSFKKNHGITCNVRKCFKKHCGFLFGNGDSIQSKTVIEPDDIVQIQDAINDIYSGVSENKISAAPGIDKDKEMATEMDHRNVQEMEDSLSTQDNDEGDEDLPLDEPKPLSQMQVFNYIKALKEFGKVKGDQEFFDKATDLEICFNNFIKKRKVNS